MTESRRWGKRAFQLIALLLVCWGIGRSVQRSAEQMREQQADLEQRSGELLREAERMDGSDAVRAADIRQEAAALEQAAGDFWRASPSGLLLASVLYALGMLPAAFFWRRCLVALGQVTESGARPGIDVLWAYAYGNLGKYFPGKAMVIVLRLGALAKYGIQRTATSVTIFMETLTMMSVGGALAAICLIVLDIDWRLTLLAVGLLVATFIPTAPPVLRYLLPRLQRGVDAETLRTWTDRISLRLLVEGWALLTLTWLAFGLSLLVVLKSLPSTAFGDSSWSVILLSSLGACALAVVLGFVSLIPGGAGVREAVLSAVLTPVVGPVVALCAALWVRVVWLATELFLVGLLAVFRLWADRKQAASSN